MSADDNQSTSFWNRIYAAVIAFLFLQIIVYSIITELLK